MPRFASTAASRSPRATAASSSSPYLRTVSDHAWPGEADPGEYEPLDQVRAGQRHLEGDASPERHAHERSGPQLQPIEELDDIARVRVGLCRERLACTLTNTPPLTQGRTNMVQVECSSPSGSALTSGAVVIATQ
jgi:hypothetical protein